MNSFKQLLKPKSVLAMALTTLLFQQQAISAERTFERAEKELRIMSKIFETTINDTKDVSNNFLSSRSSSATYLANQGMVFSFSFGKNQFVSTNDWAAFGEGVGALVGEIASEVGSAFAEVPVAPSLPEFSNNLEERMEEHRERMERLEEMREQQREQRENVRQLQREIRRIERENESSSDNSNKLRRELEAKLEMLEEKMAQYKSSMEEYRQERDKKYEMNAKKKSDAILTTLCDYGSTLRSLKDNEHVTLVFKGYSNDKDKIYVFEFEDVKDCSSADKLKEKAISYQI